MATTKTIIKNKITKKVLHGACCAAVTLTFFLPLRGSEIITSIGFNSAEGWKDGGITVAPNPPAGSWFSPLAPTAYNSTACIDIKSIKTKPFSGDGYVLIDRTQTPDKNSGGWAIDIPEYEGTVLEVCGWIKVGGVAGATLMLTSRPAKTGVSFLFAAAAITIGGNGNVSYHERKEDGSKPGSVVPVTPDAGNKCISAGYWAQACISVQLEKNEYSCWIIQENKKKVIIAENIKLINDSSYRPLPKKPAVISAGLILTGTGTWAALDDLQITVNK